MDQLQGIATGVRHVSARVSGGSDQPAGTVHTVLFRIGGRAVELKSSQPLAINEGDEMLLVGRQEHDSFTVLAHKNCTTGARQAQSWLLQAVVAVFICLLSGKIALASTQMHAYLTLLLAALLGIGGGIYFLRRCLLFRAAARIVDAAS